MGAGGAGAGFVSNARSKAEKVSGVLNTGSSLASLARTLQNDGLDGGFHDNRADDALPLETRLQGAKILLQKTRHQNEAGWYEMTIQVKRERMYATLKEETED